jgi:hypothetical protein
MTLGEKTKKMSSFTPVSKDLRMGVRKISPAITRVFSDIYNPQRGVNSLTTADG